MKRRHLYAFTAGPPRHQQQTGPSSQELQMPQVPQSSATTQLVLSWTTPAAKTCCIPLP